MLYWLFIGVGLLLVAAGFVLMIVTQREEQKTWSRLLKEDRSGAEDAFHQLQKTKFKKPLRLSLILMLSGMGVGVVGVLLNTAGLL